MATIKAGTYRFNDALTAPGANLSQEMAFQTPIVTIEGESLPNSYVTISVSPSNTIYDGTITVAYWLTDGGNFTVYNSYGDIGWNWLKAENDNIAELSHYGQIITIPNDTEVSAEFAEWFTANAVADGVQISGKWKFKDVLTESAVELYANVNFTVSVFTDSYQGTAYCDHIVFTADNESYSRLYNTLRFNVAELVPPFKYLPTPVQLLMYQTAAQDEVGGIWDIDIYGEGIKTIDFGTEPQTVSAEFYNWLTANAEMVGAQTTEYKFLDLKGLQTFLAKLKNIFGFKANLDNSMALRRQYLLEVDYEKDLAFNTTLIIGESAAPYVGQAIVGSTYVA